jgi:glycosyltransferase involved in cell wall biosynthesis
VRNLLRALGEIDKTNEYIVFTSKEGAGMFEFPSARWRQVRCPVPASSKLLRILWEQFVLPWQAKHHQVDLLHGLGYVIPLVFPYRSVVTIYDIGHVRLARMFSHVALLAWRTLVPRTARRAEAVLTISHSAKDDISTEYAIDPHRIFVATPGTDKSFQPARDESVRTQVRARYGLGARFILNVGFIKPNKNLEGLIRAFARVRHRYGLDYQLGLVGRHRYRDYSAQLSLLVSELGIEQQVIFTGYVPDEDLPALYSAADLFVFPTFYEGFGLPALEAMACGTPVALSNVSALQEVGGEAALYFDPLDTDQMAQVIGTVLLDSDLRADLARRCLARARAFSWEKTARQTLSVYSMLCSSASPSGELAQSAEKQMKAEDDGT